jgi:hypothetical protein
MQFLRDSLNRILEPTLSQETKLSFEVISPDDWKARYPGTELTRDGIIKAVYGASLQPLGTDESNDSHLYAHGDGNRARRGLLISETPSRLTFTGPTTAPSVYPGSDLHGLAVRIVGSVDGGQNEEETHHGSGIQLVGFSIQPEAGSHPTNVLAVHTVQKPRCGQASCGNKPTLIAGLSDQEHTAIWHGNLSTDSQATHKSPVTPTSSSADDRQSEILGASPGFPTLAQTVQSGINDLLESPLRSSKATAVDIVRKKLGSLSYGTFDT